MALARSIVGPVALTNTLTTNIVQGGGPDHVASVRDVITHIHVANKTAGAVTFSLWLGATGANAAGTELFIGHSVPANSEFDYYCRRTLSSTQFLVGGASAATSLTIDIEGYSDVIS